MEKVSLWVLDSFTRTRYAGNPAGVILADEALTDAQMRTIAGELSLESAFLSPPTPVNADYTVAYYTGVQRIPLCGHDTIALATALAHSNRLSMPGVVRLATDVGLLSVSIAADGQVTMTQALPQYGEMVETAAVAEALGLPANALADTGLPAQIVSTGTPFLIVPMAQKSVLNALTPDMAKVSALSESLPGQVVGLYCWTSETESVNNFSHARCFAPAIGLPEDPATGTASGALGAYLASMGRLTPDADGVARFWTEQGYAIGRPGNVRVQITLDAGQVTQVQVGGYAALVAEGKLWI